MPVEPGQNLLHYRILEKIGEGGMGQVWKALDTTLDREVAIKLLPEGLASSPERLARFEREAKLLASLNHPNIAGIYGLHATEQTRFLAMELVAGEDLATRTARGRLPVAEAVAIARQIADALEAAHGQGVIHRDLKPANVQLTPDGTAKVLDFGLAKALGSSEDSEPASPAMSPTVTSVGSVAGLILGSAAYMSPEQARGKALDRRTDIWSFGVLLYELLTGRRLFEAETISDTVAAVLTREIDWSLLPPETPTAVRRLLRRALERDPARRLRDAGDARLELDEPQGADPDSVQPDQAGTPSPAPRAAGKTIVVAAAMAVAGLAAGYLLRGNSGNVAGHERVEVAGLTKATSEPGVESFASLSPDGKMLLYASRVTGDEEIYLLRIGGQNAINLTQNPGEADTQPTFSRDGSQIAFRSSRDGGGIFVMGATGESVRRVSDEGFNPSWSPDGKSLVYSTQEVILPYSRSGTAELWVVELSSGRKTKVEAYDAVQPSWSPSGHRIAYWALNPGGGRRDIATVGLDGGEPVKITDDPAIDWNPVWSPDGRYLYYSSDRAGSMNVWRVPVDERSGRPRGEPQPVTLGASAERQWISLSADGKRLAYVEFARSSTLQRAELDPRSGKAGKPTTVTEGSLPAERPRVSGDGQWVAFSSGGVQEDIYVIRPDGSDLRQLTNDAAKDRRPAWSPDGKTLAFYSNRSGSYEIWTIQADGSRLRQLTDTPGASTIYPVWSPDGTRIVCHDNSGAKSYVLILSPDGEVEKTEALPEHPSDAPLQLRSWSRDGKRIAGNLAMTPGLWVYSLESESYRKLSDFGVSPVWMSDGRRLMFIDAGKIGVLDTETGERAEVLSLTPPAVVHPSGIDLAGNSVYFARAADQGDVWVIGLE